jgi:RimJ/RimL family protein N-acetyltransferase
MRELLQSELGNTVGPKLTDTDKILEDWAKNSNTLFVGLWEDDENLKTIISAEPSLDRHSVEVGYWTRYKAQGNGYATIGVRSLSEYLQTKYERVTAKVHSQNEASANVLKKAGYIYIGSSVETWCEELCYLNCTVTSHKPKHFSTVLIYGDVEAGFFLVFGWG